MKNLLFSFVFVIFSISISQAQAPQGINYQGVLRDDTGQPLDGQNVFIKFIILKNSATGDIVYSETHAGFTDQFGLFNKRIGEGQVAFGSFSGIDWGSAPHFLRVEVDPSGTGSNYQLLGTQQMVSVPYALYAEKSGSGAGNYVGGNGIDVVGNVINNTGDNDNDPNNERQSLSISGNQLSLSNGGGSVTLPSASQLWSQTGNNIFYSNGNVSVGTNQVVDNAKLSVKDKISVSDNSNAQKITIGLLADQSGSISVRGANGNRNVYLSSKEPGLGTPSPDRGFVGVFDENDNRKAILTTTGTGEAGFIGIYGLNGEEKVRIASNGSEGSLSIYAPGEKLITQASSTVSGGGYLGTWGPNGNLNTRLSSLSTNPDHGYIAVYDANGTGVTDQKAGIYVNALGQGVVFGDVKNFRMPHPTQPGKEIWYASIEGPEAAAYCRGTGTLTNGEGAVHFTEDFSIVANETTMTVMLTPLSGDSKGLAVIEKTAEGFKVKELLGGTGSYSFDWEAKAVRSGHEGFRVVRYASENMPALSRDEQKN